MKVIVFLTGRPAISERWASLVAYDRFLKSTITSSYDLVNILSPEDAPLKADKDINNTMPHAVWITFLISAANGMKLDPIITTKANGDNKVAMPTRGWKRNSVGFRLMSKLRDFTPAFIYPL
jgi:hypothetical protein